jgi:hypothetical protein
LNVENLIFAAYKGTSRERETENERDERERERKLAVRAGRAASSFCSRSVSSTSQAWCRLFTRQARSIYEWTALLPRVNSLLTPGQPFVLISQRMYFVETRISHSASYPTCSSTLGRRGQSQFASERKCPRADCSPNTTESPLKTANRERLARSLARRLEDKTYTSCSRTDPC